MLLGPTTTLAGTPPAGMQTRHTGALSCWIEPMAAARLAPAASAARVQARLKLFALPAAAVAEQVYSLMPAQFQSSIAAVLQTRNGARCCLLITLLV